MSERLQPAPMSLDDQLAMLKAECVLRKTCRVPYVGHDAEDALWDGFMRKVGKRTASSYGWARS